MRHNQILLVIVMLVLFRATCNADIFDAAMAGDVSEVKQWLADGVDPDIKRSDGRTPLHIAVLKDHAEVVAVLLEHGADANAEGFGASRPLHLVTVTGNVKLAKLLLEHEADPNVQDESGNTPLLLAARVANKNAWGLRFKDNAARKGVVEVAKLLLKHNASPNAKEHRYGRTSLHIVVKEGVVELIEPLLEHGASVNVREKVLDATPLHLAAHVPTEYLHDPTFGAVVRQAYADAAELLLSHGADVNVRGKAGYTPLHWAAQDKNVPVARVLLEHNADVNAANSGGLTPLDLALAPFGKSSEVASLLSEHGGKANKENRWRNLPFLIFTAFGAFCLAALYRVVRMKLVRQG